jgi:hypothetical protein
MKFAWFLVIALALALLPTPAAAQKSSQPVDANSCGPETAEFTVDREDTQPAPTDPEPGKALAFVVDDYKGALEIAGIPTIRIGLDGNWVAANRGKSYIYFSVEPGEHRLCAAGQRTDKTLANQRTQVHFTAEPGKLYYFRIATLDHAGAESTLEFHPLEPQEAKYLIADSNHTVFRPRK